MNAHDNDLPMDRVEERRKRFYACLERVLRREAIEERDRADAKPDLPALRDRPHSFERIDGVIVDLFGYDGPTPEQAAKLKPERIQTGRIDSEQGISIAYRATDGSSLARLKNRGVITEEQWRAGEAHQAVWFLAGIDAKQIGDYGQSFGGGEATYGMAPTEIAAYYREKLRAARKEMGPKVWPSVEGVVVQDQTLTDVGWMIRQKSICSRSTAIRAGVSAVKDGLDTLIEFYQIQRSQK